MAITHSYEPTLRADADLGLPSVVELLDGWIIPPAIVIDPYSGDSYHGTTFSNSPAQEPFEIPAAFHLGAGAYMEMLEKDFGLGWADAVILSPFGWQYAAYKPGKEKLGKLLRVGGIAVTVGYSSCGFREVDSQGYELLEVLVVNRGASHLNDCIVTVERKEK